MFNPQLVGSNGARTYQTPQAAYPSKRAAHGVFSALQLRYGRLFIFRFLTGAKNEDGTDKGIAKARSGWANYLAQFPDAVIAKALESVVNGSFALPPTLTEMAALCEAVMRGRPIEQDDDAGKGTDAELLSVAGLDILKRAIADAVANAGGDEARELVRLDRMLVVPSTKTTVPKKRTFRRPERLRF